MKLSWLLLTSIIPLMVHGEPSKQKTAPQKKSHRLVKKQAPIKEAAPETAAVAAAPSPSPSPTSSQQNAQAQERIFKYHPPLNQHDIYIFGEFLYWRVQQGQLDYVINNYPPLLSGFFSGDRAQVGDVRNVTYDWQPGFRIGLGTVFLPDYWDIEAQYTYIAPDGSDSSKPKPPIPASQPPFRAIGTQVQFTDSALIASNAHVSLNYNVGDLLLAKRFLVSKQILLRLVVGGTGAWIGQSLKINYLPDLTFVDNFRDSPSGKWNFQGGGVKAGLETNWFFGTGFNLVGKFNAALLYGNYRNQFFNGSFDASGNLVYVQQNNRFHDHRLASSLQFALGPSWGMNFSTWSFNILGTYELNLWYNIQKMLYAENGGASRYSNETLGLQGLTLRLQFNF